jgi:heme iron utilization protein
LLNSSGDFDAASVARELLRKARKGALATNDRDSHAPYASLVAVATDADGSPLLLLSNLAKHTMNVDADPRVSLMVEDAWAGDPLAGARVSLWGRIERTDEPRCKARFLARYPSAKGYAEFADFNFFRIEIEGAHLVAGFGRIQTLAREAVVTDVVDADDLVASEAGATAHMNEDHADAIALYATNLLGAPAGAWRMDGFDPEGAELSLGRQSLYLRFPERVTTPGTLRRMLVDLAAEARQKSPA